MSNLDLASREEDVSERYRDALTDFFMGSLELTSKSLGRPLTRSEVSYVIGFCSRKLEEPNAPSVRLQ